METEVSNIIKDIPLLISSYLTNKELFIIAENTIVSHYKKHDIIFQKGQHPTGLICLVEGKVKLFYDGTSGRTQILRLSNSGSFIGYRALFAQQNYNCSALALENSKILTIKKETIIKIMQNNASLTFEILKILAEELGSSNLRQVTLTQKHIRGRIAEGLIFLVNTYGYKSDNQTINVLLSRCEMASLCNMTTSNAIRILSDFNNEKIIELDKKDIKILNFEKLQFISNLG